MFLFSISLAPDGASSHIGKVTQIVKHAKESHGLNQNDWSPIEFEELADLIDKEDNAISGDNNDKLKNTVKWENCICSLPCLH